MHIFRLKFCTYGIYLQWQLAEKEHVEGYYPVLAEIYPFLVPVEDSDNEGKVIGVLCSLCMKHKTDQRNHAGTWTW